MDQQGTLGTGSEMQAALRTTVGMLTARFEGLESEQRALLREWQLATDGERDPSVLLAVLWSITATLLIDTSQACGFATTSFELLAPAPMHDDVHLVLRHRLQLTVGRPAEDGGRDILELANRYGVARVASLVVDDLARLVAVTAAVTGRGVSEQLQLLGQSELS